MSQTSIERLRDYLAQLPPQSLALLMREFERAVEKGEDTKVANLVAVDGRLCTPIAKTLANKGFMASSPAPMAARKTNKNR